MPEDISDRLLDLDSIVAAKFKGKKVPGFIVRFMKRFVHQDWMNSILARGFDGVEFCDDLLDQKGVLVCHGDCFYIPHSFRITLSHAHELETGLALIDEYIDELVAAGKALK